MAEAREGNGFQAVIDSNEMAVLEGASRAWNVSEETPKAYNGNDDDDGANPPVPEKENVMRTQNKDMDHVVVTDEFKEKLDPLSSATAGGDLRVDSRATIILESGLQRLEEICTSLVQKDEKFCNNLYQFHHFATRLTSMWYFHNGRWRHGCTGVSCPPSNYVVVKSRRSQGSSSRSTNESPGILCCSNSRPRIKQESRLHSPRLMRSPMKICGLWIAGLLVTSVQGFFTAPHRRWMPPLLRQQLKINLSPDPQGWWEAAQVPPKAVTPTDLKKTEATAAAARVLWTPPFELVKSNIAPTNLQTTEATSPARVLWEPPALEEVLLPNVAPTNLQTTEATSTARVLWEPPPLEEESKQGANDTGAQDQSDKEQPAAVVDAPTFAYKAEEATSDKKAQPPTLVASTTNLETLAATVEALRAATREEANERTKNQAAAAEDEQKGEEPPPAPTFLKKATFLTTTSLEMEAKQRATATEAAAAVEAEAARRKAEELALAARKELEDEAKAAEEKAAKLAEEAKEKAEEEAFVARKKLEYEAKVAEEKAEKLAEVAKRKEEDEALDARKKLEDDAKAAEEKAAKLAEEEAAIRIEEDKALARKKLEYEAKAAEEKAAKLAEEAKRKAEEEAFVARKKLEKVAKAAEEKAAKLAEEVKRKEQEEALTARKKLEDEAKAAEMLAAKPAEEARREAEAEALPRNKLEDEGTAAKLVAEEQAKRQAETAAAARKAVEEEAADMALKQEEQPQKLLAPSNFEEVPATARGVRASMVDTPQVQQEIEPVAEPESKRHVEETAAVAEPELEEVTPTDFQKAEAAVESLLVTRLEMEAKQRAKDQNATPTAAAEGPLEQFDAANKAVLEIEEKQASAKADREARVIAAEATTERRVTPIGDAPQAKAEVKPVAGVVEPEPEPKAEDTEPEPAVSPEAVAEPEAKVEEREVMPPEAVGELEPEPEQPEPVEPIDPRAAALVPINQESIEFTSGLIGGAVGYAVDGPALAAIVAAAANYVSRKQDKGANVMRTISKTALEVYNTMARLEARLQILNKPIKVLEGTLKTLKKSDPELEAKSRTVEKSKKDLEGTLDILKKSDGVDPEATKKVEDALAKVTTRLVLLNEELDPLGAGLIAVFQAMGDLVEKVLDAAGEVNEELHLTDRARAFIKMAVEETKAGLKLRKD